MQTLRLGELARGKATLAQHNLPDDVEASQHEAPVSQPATYAHALVDGRAFNSEKTSVGLNGTRHTGGSIYALLKVQREIFSHCIYCSLLGAVQRAQ
jgi:hypothetical protein